MSRMRQFGFAVGVLILLGTYQLAAQTATPPASPRGTTPNRQKPCWQQAGISQSALQQRKQIEESTRSQVESVCKDLPLYAAGEAAENPPNSRAGAERDSRRDLSSTRGHVEVMPREPRGSATYGWCARRRRPLRRNGIGQQAITVGHPQLSWPGDAGSRRGRTVRYSCKQVKNAAEDPRSNLYHCAWKRLRLLRGVQRAGRCSSVPSNGVSASPFGSSIDTNPCRAHMLSIRLCCRGLSTFTGKVSKLRKIHNR